MYWKNYIHPSIFGTVYLCGYKKRSDNRFDAGHRDNRRVDHSN